MIVCLANHKGGVGKTTTAVNLSAGLAAADRRVLLVDLDPQCSATRSLGVRPAQRSLLVNESSSGAVASGLRNLDIVPGSRCPADVTALMEAAEDGRECFGKIHGDAYDFVFVDCPPSTGRLTELALSAADEILMPIQCEYFAMEGLPQMIDVVRRVMQRPGKQLDFAGIVLTMVDPAFEVAAEVESEVREFFGEVVFDTEIPRDAALAEAASHGKSVLEYAPRSRGAKAYVELCMEVMNR